MATTMLGIDIGSSALKLAQVGGGRVQKLASSPLPDNLLRESRITSVDALAAELKTALRKHRITARSCALVLPPEAAIVRKITVPHMTVDQLLVNLPYEFHDYIQSDKDAYFYDYAVVDTLADESGAPRELTLLAAAARKDALAEYRLLLRKAGLKLTAAVPEYMAYRNLLRAYEARTPDHPAEYCVVDMGHRTIRMHMYRRAVYEATRVIDFGGAAVDALIADERSVDPHVASDYKIANYEGVQELESCKELYARIAVEILRAVNFYGFNTPDSDLRDLYFAGGLARVKPLMAEIQSSLEVRIHPAEELLPAGAEDGEGVCAPAAVGATLQTNGR